MRLNDAVIGAALILFGAVIAFWSQGFPAIPGQQYGAAVFPTLVAAGLGACGILLIASGIRQGGAAIAWSDWAHEQHGLRNVVVTAGAILFYILVADTLGFMLTMAPILLLLFRLLAVSWLAAVVLAILVTLAVQYIFGSFLYVPLPWGLLTPVRWW